MNMGGNKMNDKITFEYIKELIETLQHWEETGEYLAKPPPETPIPEVYLREFGEMK